VPVEPAPAASVILVRPGHASPVEVYLIRRAPGMRFLGGYYAFPGGKVDLADWRPETLQRTRGLDPATALARLGPGDFPVPPSAYWVTAVRELFEETGLLLVVDGAGRPIDPQAPETAERLEAHRVALVRGERSLTAILAAEGWLADLSGLSYLAHFVTPPSSPIRFSARFFLCPLPSAQAPRLILEETSEGCWVAPAAAYARFRAGEWPMAEPAEYGMRYLAQFESWDALQEHHQAGGARFDGIIDRLDAARQYRFAWPPAPVGD
jgi:8-oxo-dGTP pyrophosphatase MutT (NUDIX family)